MADWNLKIRIVGISPEQTDILFEAIRTCVQSFGGTAVRFGKGNAVNLAMAKDNEDTPATTGPMAPATLE